MTAAKTKTKLWLPIHRLSYTSSKVAWQVACMIWDKHMCEMFKTREETEVRDQQIVVAGYRLAALQNDL